jgi:broad specificity phosphatase PhoE
LNENIIKLQLPQWGESFLQARARYQQTIKELADKYPTENLLFLTHGNRSYLVYVSEALNRFFPY